MNLREATAELHSKAEKMNFNQRMFAGKLSNDEYLNYLIQQSYIFQEIENRNLPHDSLKRLSKIQEDINELGGYKFPILKSTTDYFVYLGDLNQNELNAHIYLNYLAIMFGGQMMKSKVPGSGKMYEFENQMELIDSVRAFQKDEMGDEANKALDYNIAILDELQRVSESFSN